MIYIGTNESDGSAIYFDVHAAERQGRGLRISGTIGDGSYEGEVLVETGRKESVTFADAWLGAPGYKEFIARCNLAAMEEALLDSVRGVPLLRPRKSLPHGRSNLNGAGFVGESGPLWQSRA